MSNETPTTNTAGSNSSVKHTFGMGAVFGIIMIIVYVGMGVALLADAFPWISGDWAWLRWTAGVVLIIYGIFRAWRYYKGIDGTVPGK